MFRTLLQWCALLGAAASLSAVIVPVPALAAGVNPCSLVPGNLVTVLTGAPATADLHKGMTTGRYAQDTCHYPGSLAKMFVVASHVDPAPFATLKTQPELKPLAGIGADALWWSGTGVIAMLKNGHYITMSWGGDMNKATPSAAFVAAAKAAASKL